MMKTPLTPLAMAAIALAFTGALRAQTTVEPAVTPVQSAPAITAPTPTAGDPASMTKAVPDKPAPKVGKRILARYDANKNGVLDPEERAEFEKDAPSRKADKLKKYDKNSDGKLDEQEKVQMRVDRLREADATKKAGKDATPEKK